MNFLEAFLLAIVAVLLLHIWLFKSAKTAEQYILGMLAAAPEPMYGLDMVKQSNGRLSRGVVYVWLGRLQDRGLVAATEPDHRGRRRYYLMRLQPQSGEHS